MHGRRLAPIALATLALGLAAAPAPARTIEVGEEQAGDRVSARPGDRIRIVLDANETTGYRWLVAQAPDRRVARVVASRYVADPAEPGVVGSGGEQITVVRAVRRGSTSIDLRYVQVGSESEGAVFDLAIRVRGRR